MKVGCIYVFMISIVCPVSHFLGSLFICEFFSYRCSGFIHVPRFSYGDYPCNPAYYYCGGRICLHSSEATNFMCNTICECSFELGGSIIEVSVMLMREHALLGVLFFFILTGYSIFISVMMSTIVLMLFTG